jgi:DnaJ family protein B protein 12
MFDTGPQFVFNLGGGPGIRVHQFGGARPRRRPREANGEPEAPANLRSMITSLLPLLILFVLPLLSSLFSGSSSTPSGPQFRFDTPEAPLTSHQITPKHKINYYVNPADIADITPYKLKQLNARVENTYIQTLRIDCARQMEYQQQLINDAQGWFFQDEDKMHRARNLELRSCRALDSMGTSRNQY